MFRIKDEKELLEKLFADVENTEKEIQIIRP